MLKFYCLLFHRWLALIFALPLLLVIGSGLILSFEPLAQQARPKQPITLSMIEEALARYDPQRNARSLTIRTQDNTLTIGGVGAGGSIVVDLGTGAETTDPQHTAQLFLTARRLHETLLLDLGWLVTASTIAMVVIPCLGLMIGWPRLRNSLGGWHQGMAWFALPLVILSPLSGLALAFGITLTPPAAPSERGRIAMLEAVRLIAANHDLANLTSIRPRGRILMARIFVNGELRGYRVGPAQLEPLPRNWPRLIHEGNWGGFWGPLVNIITSLVLIGLLATGVVIWSIRSLRKSSVRAGKLRTERAVS